MSCKAPPTHAPRNSQNSRFSNRIPGWHAGGPVRGGEGVAVGARHQPTTPPPPENRNPAVSPPGLTPARAVGAHSAIGPTRAHDLRDGSALPGAGPLPHLSKQAWHLAWFYRAWFYRAARASIREVLRGSGSGPALTGVIDQARSSKVGCWCEAVTKWGRLGDPGENAVRKIVPRQPRAILRIRYSSYGHPTACAPTHTPHTHCTARTPIPATCHNLGTEDRARRPNALPRGWANGALGRPHGRPPLYHPQPHPHNPGTPRWHAGVRDGRAGGGGGRLVTRANGLGQRGRGTP